MAHRRPPAPRATLGDRWLPQGRDPAPEPGNALVKIRTARKADWCAVARLPVPARAQQYLLTYGRVALVGRWLPLRPVSEPVANSLPTAGDPAQVFDHPGSACLASPYDRACELTSLSCPSQRASNSPYGARSWAGARMRSLAYRWRSGALNARLRSAEVDGLRRHGSRLPARSRVVLPIEVGVVDDLVGRWGAPWLRSSVEWASLTRVAS